MPEQPQPQFSAKVHEAHALVVEAKECKDNFQFTQNFGAYTKNIRECSKKERSSQSVLQSTGYIQKRDMQNLCSEQ